MRTTSQALAFLTVAGLLIVIAAFFAWVGLSDGFTWLEWVYLEAPLVFVV
jgi:hypothetical protein